MKVHSKNILKNYVCMKYSSIGEYGNSSRQQTLKNFQRRNTLFFIIFDIRYAHFWSYFIEGSTNGKCPTMACGKIWKKFTNGLRFSTFTLHICLRYIDLMPSDYFGMFQILLTSKISDSTWYFKKAKFTYHLTIP